MPSTCEDVVEPEVVDAGTLHMTSEDPDTECVDSDDVRIIAPGEGEEQIEEEVTSEAPDGGWGWVVVAASFLNQMLLASIFMCMPLVYVELLDVLQEKNSRLSLLGSCQTAIVYFASVFTSSLIPKIGARVMSVAGFIMLAIGLVGCALVDDVNGMFITYSAVVGIGCSLGAPPSIVIVQQYFNKRRALAAGLSACGMSIAALGGPALYRVFLSSYGWRGAFLLHGGMCLHGVVLSGAYRPLPTRKRIRNSHMTSGAPSGELTTSRTERCVQGCLQHFDLALLKDKQFVLYCCGNFFGNYGLVAFYVHFVNCAVYKGVDKKEATLLPIIMGSTALISKLIFSFVSNLKCVNRTLEYSVGTLLCGLIIGFTYPVMAFAGLCAIAAAFGIFTSILNVTQATVMVDLVGIERVAPANGILSFFVGTSVLVASPVSGVLVDSTRSYDIPFAINGVLTVIGGLFVLAIYIIGMHPPLESLNDDVSKERDVTSTMLNGYHRKRHKQNDALRSDVTAETVMSEV